MLRTAGTPWRASTATGAARLPDRRRAPYGLDELARRYLDHRMLSYDVVTRAYDGRFAAVPVDKATTYAAEDAPPCGCSSGKWPFRIPFVASTVSKFPWWRSRRP